MATLTAAITLTGSGLTSSALSVTKSPALTVSGDVKIEKVALSTSSKKILAAADYGAAYVFLHNTDSAIVMEIGEEAGELDSALDQVHIKLKAGEYAFFPWNSTVDLYADAASGTPKLEVMVFEQA